MQTVTILAQYAPAARSKLDKLQKRAARYAQQITWTETARLERRSRALWDGSKKEYEQPVVDFCVSGEAPRVGPFRFLGEIERTPHGVLISALAGTEIGALGRDWAGGCEHCNTNRGRKKAYIVENTETGERKAVGKSCLRDHLGVDVPAGTLSVFQWERAPLDDECESWGGFTPWYECTRYVIAAARAAIALWGWRPNSSCSGGERSTSGYVSLLWASAETRRYHKPEVDALIAEMTLRADEYVADADAILAWGAAMEPRGDYEHNLQIALRGDNVTAKTVGLVVSACAAYDKQKAVVEERAEQAARRDEQAAASRWFGTEGLRYRGVDVSVVSAFGMPDRGFGPSVAYGLVTSDGELLKWFTGRNPRKDGKRIEPGDRFTADFAVKKHNEFRGAQETVVTRLKIKNGSTQ